MCSTEHILGNKKITFPTLMQSDVPAKDVAEKLHLQVSQSLMMAEITQEKRDASEGISRDGGTVSDESSLDNLTVEELKQKLLEKDKIIADQNDELNDMEASLTQALETIQKFQQQQRQLITDFANYKRENDSCREQLDYLLWSYLPKHAPGFSSIPDVATDVLETVDHIGSYKLGEIIGEGQYASVYSCIDEDTGFDMAVKILDKTKSSTIKQLERIQDEIETLTNSELCHDGLLRAVEVIHTPQNIYFITERGGKDLFDYFESLEQGLPEEEAKALLKKITDAMNHFHECGYCHRDLKPENILISPDASRIKIVDFGLSSKMPEDKNLCDFCGSRGFFAPEVLTKELYDGEKADVWSIGCILLELVIGHDLFATVWMDAYESSDLSDAKAFTKIIRSTVNEIERLVWGHKPLKTYSESFRTLLLNMLAFDPTQRPSLRVVLDNLSLSSPRTSRKKADINIPKPIRRTASEIESGGEILVTPRTLSRQASDGVQIPTPRKPILPLLPIQATKPTNMSPKEFLA